MKIRVTPSKIEIEILAVNLGWESTPGEERSRTNPSWWAGSEEKGLDLLLMRVELNREHIGRAKRVKVLRKEREYLDWLSRATTIDEGRLRVYGVRI